MENSEHEGVFDTSNSENSETVYHGSKINISLKTNDSAIKDDYFEHLSLV